jgi:RNA polymerase sigma-70 factor (ECF subfamily)
MPLPLTPEKESQAIKDAQAGNAAAFGLLYDAYASRIHDYLYYRTHHREVAEDLTSKVFLKALTAFATYDAAKGPLQAWLYRIAKNALTDHWRAARPDADIEDVWDALRDTKTDLPRDADARARLAQVEAHLAALPAAQREAVTLRVWDGLSYAEMAAVTGRSEDACKMAFSRGSAALRKAMPLALLLLLLARP